MALLLCPNCGARGIGKVGSSHYYCWECCVEFRAGRKGWQVYQVLDDGSLATVAGQAERTVAGGAIQEGAIERTQCAGDFGGP